METYEHYLGSVLYNPVLPTIMRLAGRKNSSVIYSEEKITTRKGLRTIPEKL